MKKTLKKFICVFTLLLVYSISFGQIVKLQTGTLFSHLNWEVGSVNIFNKTIVGHSLFLGVDYYNKKHFNLSSNIGLIKKGGKDEIMYTDDSGVIIDSKTDKALLEYLSVNTIVDFKYPVNDKLSPFISAGPRLDILIDYNRHFDSLDQLGDLNKLSVGFIVGGGVKYQLNKLEVGFRIDYYLNLNKVADWPAETNRLSGSVSDRTFTTNFTIGYRIK
ncbi:hypothetical protein CYCD_24530 [Tenuifilaceae bacterium CYCD]|nr:hypothetical protein CYCD_24530 [Tenuifilaceae bacterium CYCD]